MKLNFKDRNFCEGKLKTSQLKCRYISAESVGAKARAWLVLTMRNVCVYEFVLLSPLPLILSGSRLRHRFTPWESATAMGLAAGARRNSIVGCDRRDGVSHTCGVATLSMIRCGKRVESTCARAKLRNYRRSASLLLGRYAVAFAHAREREQEREREREIVIESNQPGKWRVKLQWR